MIETSCVEDIFINKSGFEKRCYSDEHITTIVVDHFPELGRFAALRFLEWVQHNPSGVISLPTGKTPEHFINWVTYFLLNWNKKTVQDDLETSGVNPQIMPDMKSLQFVQMDEFYPIDSRQENSFCHYVRKYYIEGFGLDPEKSLVIDCNSICLKKGEDLSDVWQNGIIDLKLRERDPKSNLEKRQKIVMAKIDSWCLEYESRIQDLGGIGFFLGGIGPDGHVAFNIRGSSHEAVTRLTETNYETQAASAEDLGGIELSGRLPVITIGLNTICANPNCTAVIMAAGSAKSRVIGDAIQNVPDCAYPATALQKLPNAAFYLTKSAATKLYHRQLINLERKKGIAQSDLFKSVIDLSLSLNKSVLNLQIEDFKTDKKYSIFLKKQPDLDLQKLKQEVHCTLVSRIEKGMAIRSGQTFLHTEPHHDDIMLGYLPALVHDLQIQTNSHHFSTLTSGFKAVSNICLMERTLLVQTLLKSEREIRQLSPDEEVHLYITSLAAKDEKQKQKAEALRFLRCISQVFKVYTNEDLKRKAVFVISYLQKNYPGKKDIKEIQLLKGMIREWEVETLWGALGIGTGCVSHLRMGFYQGKTFTGEPDTNRDIPPIQEMIKRIDPDILTVALDPEGSGPDTHYKVLQSIAAAVGQLKKLKQNLPQTVWGYRNVWYRFHPSKADLFIPVSLGLTQK